MEICLWIPALFRPTSAFLTEPDAERVLLEAQDQLAISQTRSATALVTVYKSLGGGWENETNSATQK